MRNLIAVSLFLALAVGLALAPAPAGAADVFKASLTSNDAGSTNTASMQTGLRYSLQCAQEACYVTGTAAVLAPDCTTAYILPQLGGPISLSGTSTSTVAGLDAGASTGTLALTGSNGSTRAVFGRDFESGTHSKIAATALDGGNPACVLFQSTRNP